MAPGPLTRELQFEKKNKNLIKLPKYAKVQKRPIPHPPISSPYSGPQVPKTVYISTKTPFMSAVKRVQKLLRYAEKRAISSALSKTSGKLSEREKLARIASADEELRIWNEEVFIKATGRAIEKALSVGKWFEGRPDEYEVRVKTGSVLVVDDIVEDEEKIRAISEDEGKGKERQQQDEETEAVPVSSESLTVDSTGPAASTSTSTRQAPSKQTEKNRKHAAISSDIKLPETRTRWVNMVEIAVSLK
ncbi:hypothetical protein MPDQ_002266 [Monascus purpureus]|uniref:Uncharacterized protein n=1 Tax=Monascus purpureus TaxID=5098 RepID=A0A507R4Z4_MONPU|nr:hypothetical protein MPDQ_002266 [Monascus purpureus]BDD59982.1 hypothetical protein MAP00_005148 [Monascus purpureus]